MHRYPSYIYSIYTSLPLRNCQGFRPSDLHREPQELIVSPRALVTTRTISGMDADNETSTTFANTIKMDISRG
jgi:hypothetical protein